MRKHLGWLWSNFNWILLSYRGGSVWELYQEFQRIKNKKTKSKAMTFFGTVITDAEKLEIGSHWCAKWHKHLCSWEVRNENLCISNFHQVFLTFHLTLTGVQKAAATAFFLINSNCCRRETLTEFLMLTVTHGCHHGNPFSHSLTEKLMKSRKKRLKNRSRRVWVSKFKAK